MTASATVRYPCAECGGPVHRPGIYRLCPVCRGLDIPSDLPQAGDMTATTTYYPTTPAEILAAPCGSRMDTGERIVLTVNMRHDLTGLVIEDGKVIEPGTAAMALLTQDGRTAKTDTWHTGPEADWVYVERWTSEGRVFHGWIDSVSRRLLQAG